MGVRLNPQPGATLQIPGVQVPVNGPTEQQATDAAVSYGWLIAVVIVAAVLIKFGRFILQSKPVQILAAIVAGFFLYKIMHGSV